VGQVWDFIRSQSGLWTDGHNVFLYHQPKELARLLCDFGVEINRTCEPAGRVYSTRTPGVMPARPAMRVGSGCSAPAPFRACADWPPGAGCLVKAVPAKTAKPAALMKGSRPRGIQLAPLWVPMLADTSDRVRHERVPV